MPEKVQRWRRAYDTGDQKLRSLLERHAVSLTHKRIPNAQSTLLLTPPPANRAKGKFNLGTIIYHKELHEAGLTEKELLQNLAIFGRSGAGKTNLVLYLLGQLADRSIPFIMFDWKRTGRHALPLLKKATVYTPGRQLNPLPFNPLTPPPGLEQHIHTNLVIDNMSSAYTLGDGAKSILQNAIALAHEKKRNPVIQDIRELVEQLDAGGREAGWKTTALRCLQSIANAQLISSENGGQLQALRRLSHSYSIIELDGLDQNARTFLVPLLCLWVYYLRLNQPDREKLRLVVVIEEAHQVLYARHSGGETVMEMLIRQCRELGISMVIIDQHPSLISKAVLGNTFTTCCFNLKSPSDIRTAGQLSLLSADDASHLSKLPTGHAIIKKQDRWKTPFHIKTPHIRVNKGQITDQHLKRLNIADSAHSQPLKPEQAKGGRVSQVPSRENPLDESSISLLKDVQEHPIDGVKGRYKRLMFSTRKAHRIKQNLVDLGMLEESSVLLRRTSLKALRLTAKARNIIGINENSTTESHLHWFWKSYYAEFMREINYRVYTEARLNGCVLDVLAVRSDRSIGIQVETGFSDMISNVESALRSNVSHLAVVATDEIARRRITRALDRVATPLRKRVSIEFRDSFVEKAHLF